MSAIDLSPDGILGQLQDDSGDLCWMTSYDMLIRIVDLTDSHLYNIIAMLDAEPEFERMAFLSDGTQLGVKNCNYWSNVMNGEVSRRTA